MTQHSRIRTLGFMVTSAFFIAASPVMAASKEAHPKDQLVGSDILPGNYRVGGDISTLKPMVSDPTQRISQDSYKLIFFTTGHYVPSCDGILPRLAQAYEGLNMTVKADVDFVIIYPFEQGDNENTRNLSDIRETKLIGLNGSEMDVFELADGYAAKYVVDKNSGQITGHTAFAYLMDPQGRNRAIFPLDILDPSSKDIKLIDPGRLEKAIPQQIESVMHSDGVSKRSQGPSLAQ